MALIIGAISTGVVSGTPNPAAQINMTGLTGGGAAYYRVTRSYDGKAVRGADNLPIIADAVAVFDWEMTLGVSTSYTVSRYNSSHVFIDQATTGLMTVAQPANAFPYWFKKTGTPVTLNAIVGDWSETSYEPTVLGSYKVLGREKPVVFTDVWGARQGSMSVLSIELMGRRTTAEDLEAYFKSGDVLLFQSSLSAAAVKDMYFVITALERTAYTRPKNSDFIEYTYQLGFQEVDRPPTSGLTSGFGTWGQLKTDPSTVSWADVAAQNATWLAVLQRYSNS